MSNLQGKMGDILIGDADCSKCQRLHLGEVACDAFPDGIPMELWFGRVLHREPYPGDHGVQFEYNPGLNMTTDELLAWAKLPREEQLAVRARLKREWEEANL